MGPESIQSSRLMYHLVVVRPEPPGQFTAQPLGVPEIQAVAATAEEAIAQAQRALTEWAGALYWVPIERPASAPLAWPPGAGHAKDDPDFDLYLEAIRRYRQEVETRECSDSSSTPIT